MDRFRIVPYNHHDDATLAASSLATGFVAEDTQNIIRSRVWLASGLGNQWMTGVLPDARTATFFGLFRHNLFGGDIQLELFAGSTPSGASIFDSTLLPAEWATGSATFDFGKGDTDIMKADTPYVCWIPPGVGTFQSYKITIENVPVAVQVCRIVLGLSFEVGFNPAYGAQLGAATLTDKWRTRGGSRRSLRSAIWRTAKFDFNWIDEADRETWLDIMHYCGTDRDVVVSLFPEDGTRKERDYTINGTFIGIDSMGRQIAALNKTVQLEEC